MYIKTAHGWRQLEVFCVNTPVGVYKPQSLQEIRNELDKRIQDFCTLMLDDDAKSWNRPLYGAFGERL